MRRPRLDIRGRLVFLASTAYSGSTLLSFLLAAHPEIGSISDVSGTRRRERLDSFGCSCGRPMRACPFWTALGAELDRSGHRFRLEDFELGFDAHASPLVRRLRVRTMRTTRLELARDRLFSLIPATERRMRELGVRNAVFAAAVMRVTGTSVFVDASKERLRARYLRRYTDPELRVIHLVRDVRGVVDSAIRRHDKTLPPGEIARRWRRANEAVLRTVDDLGPGRATLVRYEDLCADPRATMQRLFTFCGVDPDVEVDPHMNDEQHLLGNRMRLAGMDEIRLDERWRDGLSPADERAVLAEASGLVTMLDAKRAGAASRPSIANG